MELCFLVHSICTDYSKAFDCVHHSLLLAKLGALVLRGMALKLKVCYWKDANMKNSFFSNVPSGVPQGSHFGHVWFMRQWLTSHYSTNIEAIEILQRKFSNTYAEVVIDVSGHAYSKKCVALGFP